tara:strand:+ start:212653 stop:212988 length:336 start_codon:yes stop_codon:yes gene_type:complete
MDTTKPYIFKPQSFSIIFDNNFVFVSPDTTRQEQSLNLMTPAMEFSGRAHWLWPLVHVRWNIFFLLNRSLSQIRDEAFFAIACSKMHANLCNNWQQIAMTTEFIACEKPLN